MSGLYGEVRRSLYLESCKHRLNAHPQNFCRNIRPGPLHPLKLVVPAFLVLPRLELVMGSGPHSLPALDLSDLSFAAFPDKVLAADSERTGSPCSYLPHAEWCRV